VPGDTIKPHYDEARAAGKAVGLGLGLKNSGPGQRLQGVDQGGGALPATTTSVEVRHGWTEMGQGIHTVAMQVVVEELGVDPSRIVVIVDTTRELGNGQTTGPGAP
jgi:aldehyde oxidoreductase